MMNGDSLQLIEVKMVKGEYRRIQMKACNFWN